jgi:hypothetical protein
MRASVPLELPSAKGDLTEADVITRARARSGRLPPFPVGLTLTKSHVAAATSAAAEPKGSFSCSRCAPIISRTSLLTAELSGAHAGV